MHIDVMSIELTILYFKGLQVRISINAITFCLLGKYFFFYCLLIFIKINFSKKFRNTIRVSNRLDPDQAWHSVRPDLGPKCLQSLSVDG